MNTADETEERKFSLTFADNLPHAQSTVMTEQHDGKSQIKVAETNAAY